MRSLIEKLSLIGSNDDLFEMANLKQAETGLGYPVYVSHKGNTRHASRVKVYPEGKYDKNKSLSISISDKPSVVMKSRKYNPPQSKINDAFKFVKLNSEILQQYWDDNNMATSDLLSAIKKIS